MKIFKIFASCFLSLIVAVSFFTFSGCASKTNKKTSNSTQGVVSNGGMVVQKDSFIYFVNGAEETTAANTFGSVSTAAIFKAQVDENGGIVGTPTRFVPSIVGFEFGSIHIFGNYLYYATPSTSKDSTGNFLSGLVEFWRIKLDGTDRQKLFTTKNADDDIKYAFYSVNEKDLFLVVYEPKSSKIVSVDIGSNPKIKTIAKNVTSVVFSENGGIGGANAFVFYTKATENDAAIRTGNVVCKVQPNGDFTENIASTGETFSLLAIRDGKLIYSVSDMIFANGTGDELSIQDNIISYLASSAYKDLVLFGDKVIVRDEDGDVIQIKWNGDELSSVEICNAEASFVCVDGSKLVYTVNKILYAVDIAEDSTPVKLCTDSADAANGLLVAEVVGNYVYFLKTTTNSNVSTTRLYRVLINLTSTGTALLVGPV